MRDHNPVMKRNMPIHNTTHCANVSIAQKISNIFEMHQTFAQLIKSYMKINKILPGKSWIVIGGGEGRQAVKPVKFWFKQLSFCAGEFDIQKRPRRKEHNKNSIRRLGGR